jgi:hypothetical protein
MGRKLLPTSSRKTSPGVPQTNILGLQTFLRNKFAIWASNGRCVEEVWTNFKNIILESIERFIPHKILRKNSDLNATIKN